MRYWRRRGNIGEKEKKFGEENNGEEEKTLGEKRECKRKMEDREIKLRKGENMEDKERR